MVKRVRPSIRGLPGRFLGEFPNPAVCEEKKVDVSDQAFAVARKAEFPVVCEVVFNVFKVSDQVSVPAREGF
jgi:hypothetical protein